MKIEVGDVIKPKEPKFIEEVYNVKYRVLDINEEKVTAKLEVIVDEDKLEKIIEVVKHDIDISFETIPSWISCSIKVEIDKEYVEYVFDEEDWEVVG